MISKKMISVLSMLLVLTMLLVGCGGTQQTATSSSAPSASGSSSAQPSSAAPSETAKAPTDIAIGTAAAGGAWYPIGAAMSDIISTSDIGIKASVQTTGGGIENCKLVNSGDTEIGITIGYLAYNAQNGLDPYKDKMTNFSLLFSGLSTGVMQVVVPENSKIQSYVDLKGKKVAVGPAGGGAITALQAALEQYGIKYTEIQPSYVSYDEGVTMMTDGHVDAAVVYGGIPTPAIKTLEAGKKSFRILTLSQEEQDKIAKEYSYFDKIVIPASMYGLPQDVLTLGTPNIVIVNNDMPEDTVYNICKLFFTDENLEKIKNSQPSAKGLTLEKAAVATIPFHKGAEKFFKEKGLLK